MSKAIIVSHLGDGKYRVKLQIDIKAIKARITDLEKRIEKANITIAYDLQNAVDTALAALNALAIPLGEIIDSLELSQINKDLADARQIYDKAVAALNREKIARENARAERGKLIVYKAEEMRDIWCADYTTGLNPDDEVGIIDWYQFRGKSTPGNQVILPAYLTGKESAYNKVRDGKNMPQAALKVYGWWYAMMFVPGMERFNPHYRKGEIIAINGDGTVNVTIDDVYTQVLHSTADGLTADEINLVNVPVKYLTCNAGAFAVHDRVVLEYPRKNIHFELINSFTASCQALEVKKVTLQQRITDYDAQIAAKKTLIDELQVLLSAKIALLLAETSPSAIVLLQNDIDNLNEQIINEGHKQNGLNDNRTSTLVQVSDIDMQIIKLQAIEAIEQSNYAKLKAYTDTRPKEITVIGFVENPRPCNAIAFKDSSGAWKMVKPNGNEYPLSTPPALVGDYNWGVQNKYGRYDCACVWNGSVVRHGGYNYETGTTIKAAGVIKDSPGLGFFTIKVISGDGLSIVTVVVKDGIITSNVANTITGSLPDFTVGTGTFAEPGNVNPTAAELSAKILVDKSGLFAVAASLKDFKLYQTGRELPKGAYSKIYIIDLVTFVSVLISDHHYWTPYPSDDSTSSILVDSQSSSTPTASIVDGTIRYEHDTLCYGLDGEITMSAMIDVSLKNTPTTHHFEITYAEVTFKNKIINRGKTLYKHYSIEDPVTADGGIDDIYTKDSQQLLCILVDNREIYPICLHRQHFVQPYPSIGDEKLILPFTNMILNANINLISGFPDYLTTQKRVAGDFTGATVEGFAAGCVKVKSDYTPNKWLEFRGTRYKLVDQPSTDYTILI